MKTLDVNDCGDGRDGRDDGWGRETADFVYLRERWPDVPEGVLLDALVILNNASVNQ